MFVCIYIFLLGTDVSLYFMCLCFICFPSIELYTEPFLADCEGPGKLLHTFLVGEI